MDLKDKLRRFSAEKPVKQESVVALETQHLTVQRLGGQEIHNQYGCFQQIDIRYPLDYVHGSTMIGEALELDPALLAFLAKDLSLANIDLQTCLFIDTETTGLAGGAGTYAFLVGTGRFYADHFVVRQYLMRDFPEELALLAKLKEDLASVKTLISFNGKSFDWPLLKDRFAMHRFRPDYFAFSHLDLLHPSRRMWRKALPSCSLGSLESNILGVHRSGDIPGCEIPQRFFDFLKTGKAELLKDILEHNVIDIVSMVTLYVDLALRGSRSPLDCASSSEAECIAILHQQAGDYPAAIRYLQTALCFSLDTLTKTRLLSLLAAIHKRLGQFEPAEKIWLELIVTDNIWAYEELAKYYEHKKKDLGAAITMTRRGLALALRQHLVRVPAFEHRLDRLERSQQKIQRQLLELG